MEFPRNNIINDWLQENGNPEIAKHVEKNTAIANKIHTILEENGYKDIKVYKDLSGNDRVVTAGKE